MCSASGSRASRVYMDGLPECGGFGACGSNGLADAIWGGSAGDVVNFKHGLEGEGGLEIRAKGGIDALEFGEGQIFQLAVSLQAELDRFADLFVRKPEWDALTD